ncbi:S1 family peptidase [Bosea caraganae]|uniref:S1 family peptidase n=1 Tax=Bosea caraganae TaxID=2763117 RepID=A0A370L3T3_9HYPH|nr:trypsin-like serine protease [Bosea caraganae]RDJ22998.1 S1 family peptidase [Bosea caraganae]RDJ28778.1 S1 family peptidase [Bosea caraganae]
MTPGRWIAGAGLALTLLPAPAQAVVGGREGGPAAASTVMVLNARGGVCTGIVLSSRAILTAAHCTEGGVDLRVHWKDGSGEPVLIAPTNVSFHPEFDAKAITTRRRSVDLALLRLPSALPGRFSPATLFDGSLPRAGTSITVAGYGVSREGEARTTGTYRSAGLSAVEPYGPGRILIWASDPETGGKKPGAGACQGDSGGPILLGSKDVVAVSSWSTGPKGRNCGLLSQGVLVAPQRGWIDGTLSQWGESASWTTGR